MINFIFKENTYYISKKYELYIILLIVKFYNYDQ